MLGKKRQLAVILTLLALSSLCAKWFLGPQDLTKADHVEGLKLSIAKPFSADMHSLQAWLEFDSKNYFCVLFSERIYRYEVASDDLAAFSNELEQRCQDSLWRLSSKKEIAVGQDSLSVNLRIGTEFFETRLDPAVSRSASKANRDINNILSFIIKDSRFGELIRRSAREEREIPPWLSEFLQNPKI